MSKFRLPDLPFEEDLKTHRLHSKNSPPPLNSVEENKLKKYHTILAVLLGLWPDFLKLISTKTSELNTLSLPEGYANFFHDLPEYIQRELTSLQREFSYEIGNIVNISFVEAYGIYREKGEHQAINQIIDCLRVELSTPKIQESEVETHLLSGLATASSIILSGLNSYAHATFTGKITAPTPADHLLNLMDSSSAVVSLASVHFNQFMAIATHLHGEIHFDWEIHGNQIHPVLPCLTAPSSPFIHPRKFRPDDNLKIGCPATKLISSLGDAVYTAWVSCLLGPNFNLCYNKQIII